MDTVTEQRSGSGVYRFTERKRTGNGMKYRIHMKKSEVVIKGRLGFNERVNERELDYLLNNSISGLFHITYDGKKQLIYEAPCPVSLEKYLKSAPLSENSFWRVMTQMVDIAMVVKSRGLYPAHLLVKPDTVFIREDTLELFFIYQPVISPTGMTDQLFAVIHDIIYLELSMAGETKPGYLIDFQNYLQQSDYSLEHVRQYIRQPSAWRAQNRLSQDYGPGQDGGPREDLDQYTVLLGSNNGRQPQIPAQKQPDKKIYLLRTKTKELVTLSGELSFLGRSNQSDYCIAGNSSIGRKHAVIKKQGNACYLMDLGSVNGTFLNGKRLAEKQICKLNNGDKIQLSDEAFLFELK